MKTLFKKYWHALMLIYFLIYMPWFGWLNIYTPTRTDAFEMNSTLDAIIPFCEWFAIPYFLWFLYIAAGYVFLFFNNRSDFLRMCTFLYVGMTTCLIIYMIFPNYQLLRIDYDTLDRSNLLIDALKLLQNGDSYYDVFPSIHCLNSIGMNIALAKNKWCQKHPWLLFGVTLLSISICISTVFVKQHSILDVFGAIVLAIPLYFISYVIPWKKILLKLKK